MWARRQKRDHAGAAGTATLTGTPGEEHPESLDALSAEIEALAEANRQNREPDRERRLLRLRHLAGLASLDASDEEPQFVEPEVDRLPQANGLPEINGSEVTAGVVRAGILRDGCLLVRRLVAPEEALRFAGQIDRAYEERERHDAGQQSAPGYYEEFEPDRRSRPIMPRDWIKRGGGLLAADSPLLSSEMMNLFRAAGLPQLVSDYLGEPALISVEKSTLRKADPSVPGAWHQDGFFMGSVRSLNLWLSLSRCGDEAPGLDILPRRLDYLVTTATEDAPLDYTISQQKAEEAAGETPIIRPIFEPGDALLFDEMFLHQTGSDPSMPKPRYAIENWFFGGSAFPREYAPLSV